jgi:hypothetical protein
MLPEEEAIKSRNCAIRFVSQLPIRGNNPRCATVIRGKNNNLSSCYFSPIVKKLKGTAGLCQNEYLLNLYRSIRKKGECHKGATLQHID